MGYSIIDLLNKLIVIEQNACKMYKNIATLENNAPASIRTAARVLAKEEERHIEFYNKLKKKASLHVDIDIDFDIYDKASSLVQEFKKYIASPHMNNAQELINFALELEKENVALLLNIQGRLVRGPEDNRTTSYITLTDLITEEQKHIDNLKAYVGK